MAKETTKLNWNSYEPAELPKDLEKMYGEMVEARESFSKKQERYHAAFIEHGRKTDTIDTDETFKFSYRFGPSVAISPLEEPKAKAKAKKGFTFG